jgi:hypothetical protein
MQLLLIIVLCLSAFAQSPKQHAGNKQDAQAQADKTAVDQHAPDTVKAPETQINTNNYHNPEGNETAKNMSDGLLALFTLALVVVSVMQWRVLRKHEEWMQKHDAKLEKLAEAALLNARSFISSERPWIIVVVRKEKGILTFSATNDGRSPAVIVDCFAQWSVQPNVASLPAPPNYGTAIPKTIPLLIPNHGHDELGPFIELLTFLYDLNKINDPNLYEAIETGRQRLFFWFKIIYTSQLAIGAKLPPYETRCCFEYSPTMTSELRTTGPAEYNEYK